MILSLMKKFLAAFAAYFRGVFFLRHRCDDPAQRQATRFYRKHFYSFFSDKIIMVYFFRDRIVSSCLFYASLCISVLYIN